MIELELVNTKDGQSGECCPIGLRGPSGVAARPRQACELPEWEGNQLVTAISFRLLGPLEVSVAGRAVPLGGVKPRTLLAALVLEAGVTVSVGQLVDVLWPREPPRSATANIRTYVHFLRRNLAGNGTELVDRIQSRSSGYVLHAAGDEIDSVVFEANVARAHDAIARGDRSAALEMLSAVEGLWRGAVLADLPHSHTWSPALARFTELRLAAQEQRARIRIDLGQYGEAAAELRGLLTANPLREELWAQLIVALHAGGRPADAINAYAEAERVLREELDAEPGPRLRRILSSLAKVPAVTSRPDVPVVSPVHRFPVCQLPLDLPDFAGRQTHVVELVGLLRTRGRDDLPTVVVFCGLPGVGKSALATRVAHRVRADFPDGQLHVDLGGTTAAPRNPMDVLGELLHALGVPEVRLPRDLSGRAALWRSRLAAAHVLVVLDDAGDSAQVRPLLPGAGSSAVLVTSRVRLSDLTGAHAVELGVLPPREGAELLASIVGATRISAEPDEAAAIVESCGCLPLAIRVAATKLACRPEWTLRMFAERLADEHRRLDELRLGNLAVRDSIALSYEQLSGSAAAAFRGVGSLGAVRFPAWLVAAVLDRPRADDVLDALVDAGLVDLVASDACGQPRHRLPDLLRIYAVEQARCESHAVRSARLRRVLEGYLFLATEAAKRVPVPFTGVADELPQETWRPANVEKLVADPMAWFEAESDTVHTVAALAAELGLDELGRRVTAAFTPAPFRIASRLCEHRARCRS